MGAGLPQPHCPHPPPPPRRPQVSPEVASEAEGCDLVIIEGMGRGIETNLRAAFKCDTAKLAMVKHPEVAALLGGRLYDVVCKFDAAPRL